MIKGGTNTSELDSHYRMLESMYLQAAPINNELYKGITLSVSHESAELSLKIEPKFFHAANALHGSVYFKMLDDAAYFAVNSVVEDVLVYTVSFDIRFLKPVTGGILKAIGTLKTKSDNLFSATSRLYDEDGKLVGRGTGNFVRSRILLSDEVGYK